jgi:hypothetical protein
MIKNGIGNVPYLSKTLEIARRYFTSGAIETKKRNICEPIS